MPSNYTSNYHLNQWDPEDKVLRTDFNADNARIDGALKAETDARISADAAEVQAREALSAQVAKLGNCQIWTTTYRGTGKCGADHPTRFTFPRMPVAAMIEGGGGAPTFLFPRDGWMYVAESDHPLCRLSWNGPTASWYSTSANPAPASQLNATELTYRVVALFAMDE